VVKGGAGFEACAFLLEQDVRPITEEEFYVTDEWIGMWKPIAEISGKMRGYTCRIWRPSIGGVAKPSCATIQQSEAYDHPGLSLPLASRSRLRQPAARR